MPIQKLQNTYKLLSAGEKIATWSTIASFLGVSLSFISWIYPKEKTLSVAGLESSVPEIPVIIDSKSRSSYRNELTPLEALEIMEGYSSDSARLNYLDSIKEDIVPNFDLKTILGLLDLMENDLSRLRAIKLVENKTEMLYSADAKEIISKFEEDSSKNLASKAIRNINE
jgi:hypothetical protein